MVEKRVYDGWAFSQDEAEKGKSNKEIYNEISQKWRISSRDSVDESKYDLILSRTPGYLHSTYHIVKNATDLTQDEIALVCDGGNLCFGYTMQGKQFYVFED